MMPIIVSHDLVTLESKAALNPHCGFSFNEASDWPIYSSTHIETSTRLKQQYNCWHNSKYNSNIRMTVSKRGL